MTDFRIILPVIDSDLATACLGSMTEIDPDRVLIVDNRPDPSAPLPRVGAGYYSFDGHNIGVSASWNIGASELLRVGGDVLVICSQAVVFLDGGASLVEAVGAADEWGVEVVGAGWHLLGLTAKTLRAVGPFDEGFYPGYYEDTDYLYRMGLLGLPSPRENGRSFPFAVVDFADAGNGLMIQHVHPAFGALAARYREKWGGEQGNERYRTPYNSGSATWWWPGTPYNEADPWAL